VSVADVAVVVLGAGVIVGELWYFLGPRPRAQVRREPKQDA
jgi:hypothetical protein